MTCARLRPDDRDTTLFPVSPWPSLQLRCCNQRRDLFDVFWAEHFSDLVVGRSGSLLLLLWPCFVRGRAGSGRARLVPVALAGLPAVVSTPLLRATVAVN